MSQRVYTFNEDYINLGEIGEHELQITAVLVGDTPQEAKAEIRRAIAIIKFPKVEKSVQIIDVTYWIANEQEWRDRVTKSYRDAVNKEWNGDESA